MKTDTRVKLIKDSTENLIVAIKDAEDANESCGVVEDFINNYAWCGQKDNICPRYKRPDISLLVPFCNTNWTFTVFDFIKAFCEEFPGSYPSHVDGDKNLHITVWEK